MPAPLRYFDFQATTPLAPEALAAMMPYLTERHGNPHSAAHRAGWEAKAGVDLARADVAALVGGEPSGLLFTSGATEANNLALIGALEAAPASRDRLVTVATEHASLLETAAWLARRGIEVTLLPVGPDGLLDLARVEAALDERVALLSVMAVNNEIGVIQPLAALAAAAHRVGALFHSDAAQAAGKIPLDVDAMAVDLMSLSAHKCYGPKGVGALHLRPGVRLAPHLHGGGQEGGLRSGTLSPALCAGFGAAARLAGACMAEDGAHASALFDRLLAGLDAAGVAYRLNGSAEARWRGNANLSFPGCDGARLLADCRGFALASGAACASAEGKESMVLAALGLEPSLKRSALRIGFGRPTTAADVDALVATLTAAVRAQPHAYRAGA